ncbi:hypothetical protein CDL12_22602 [Handroanthus impetiginosus]|uniref:Uncharacterized protein n=1 Tax=Handroanthus impetiginosus TaxID=429701 RepID=A0A2G9GHU4_9LAMI|nr:hypothetical protein CDL12_25407 [Handroanthus impetiginosus]PIN04859.1 hypothetical protein CDL12_22602 [Handroanthus impetiginosus]
MEKIGEDLQEKELKSHTAIRCAKAAILLSSLRNATNSFTSDVPQIQEDEKIEMLKIELVKKKQKLKKMRLWIGVSLLSYLLIFLILPFFLKSL